MKKKKYILFQISYSDFAKKNCLYKAKNPVGQKDPRTVLVTETLLSSTLELRYFQFPKIIMNQLSANIQPTCIQSYEN